MKNIGWLAVILPLVACNAIPASTKNDAMQMVSEVYTIEGNYKGVGKYWDENSTKCYNNGSAQTRLEIDERARNAQLIFYNGSAYYGIIELQEKSKDTTRVIMHTWGSLPCIDGNNEFLKRNFKVLSVGD